jgi:Transposase
MAARPPALLDLGRYPGGGTRRHPASMSLREDAVGQPTTFVGIDVSKDTLDACLLAPGGQTRQESFPNGARGHTALIRWADQHAAGPCHFCLEATGPYSEAPALALVAAGPARQCCEPDPHQVCRADARAGEQDRPRRCPADRRVRPGQQPASLASAHAGGAHASEPRPPPR